MGVHRARLELLIGIFVYEKSPNNVLRQLSYIKENNIKIWFDSREKDNVLFHNGITFDKQYSIHKNVYKLISNGFLAYFL